MKNVRLLFGLLIIFSLQSMALPVRFARMLKIAARYTRVKAQEIKGKAREIKSQATSPWARRNHPGAIPTSSALRPTPHVKKILTHRLAPLAFTSVATTAVATRYKEKQKEAKRKIDEYNQEVIHLFAHGMKSSSKAGWHRHVNSQRLAAFIQGALATFDFKDTVQASSASFGQEDDVRKLEEVCRAYPGQRKILVGSSRGAATCINYLGSKQTPDIGAAVVESPFGSLETLISPQLKPVFKWWFPHYQSHGLQPVQTAATVSKDIPVFIFCSKDDEVIPVSQTIDVYNALRASGHTKCHLFIVDHGAHAKILGNKDGRRVRNVIHAFYKEYNIPYNKAWAIDGQEDFKQTNPGAHQLKSISEKAKVGSFVRMLKMSGGISGSR